MKDEFDRKRSLFFKNTQYLFKHPDLSKFKITDEEYQEKYKQYPIGGFITHYEQFHIEVENALDEYLMFKYNISSEQIKKVMDNTNNFKLKHNNFMKVVQGDFESWFDNGELFMTTCRRTLKVHRRWEWEEINNGQI